jgi:hypothetical protein
MIRCVPFVFLVGHAFFVLDTDTPGPAVTGVLLSAQEFGYNTVWVSSPL